MFGPTDDLSQSRYIRLRFAGGWVAIVALYLIGVLHWDDFFNRGDISFRAHDWPKERLYLQVIRDAFHDRRLPLHVQVPTRYIEEFPQFANHGQSRADVNRPSRFLALPETILSPQLLLLPSLSDGRFMLVNFVMLYSIGFLGCVWIRARYGLSLIPFAVLFLLFNFNGYITSHLGVGHVMWGGYFLLPFFALFTLECIEKKTAMLPGLKLGSVLFAMLLQGSLHMVVWCWMFIALMVIANPSTWRSGIAAVVFSGLLAGFRLIPAAAAYWGFPGLPFGGGYPTLMTLLEATLVIRPSSYLPAGHINWWEYDLYVGLLGLSTLAYFGVYKRFQRDPALAACRFPGLDIPLLFMAVMSMGHLFYPVYRLPFPLVNSERVTSRFIIIPFVVLLVLAVIRMQRVLAAANLGIKGTIVIALTIVLMWWSLTLHFTEWTVHKLEEAPGSLWHELQTAELVNQTDGVYVWSLIIGAPISILSVTAWIYAFRRCRNLTA